MRKYIFSIWIVLFFLFYFAYGFQKQQKPSKPLEHDVTVELVVVEVFVTDKKGNFVDNLTRDDFEIYEDGKKVDIYYFNIIRPKKEIIEGEVKEKIIERKKPLPPKPPQEVKLVILFDNINSNRFYLSSQWPQIVEMLKALSSKVEEIMVMELSREFGARIISPLSSDQTLLFKNLSKFKYDLLKAIEEEMRKREMRFMEEEAQKALEDRFVGNPFYIMDCLMKEENILRRVRLTDSFSAFLAAVNYIRQFDGVKSVLIISDGFHLENLYERGIIADGGHYKFKHRDVVRLFDPFKLFGGKKYLNQQQAFDKLLQLINEEKFIFYAFSPKGLKPDFSVTEPLGMKKTFQDEIEQWSKERYTLEELADETGGMYFKGEKKYENFIKELGRDLTHFYDISYAPPKRRKRGEYHKIEVKVKKPGFIVRHKKGYLDFTERDIEKRNLASAFLSPSFFKDISFSCKTDFIFLGGGYPQFWIRLKIPLDQFRENQNMSLPGEVELLFGINEWEENRIHLGGRVLWIKETVEKGLNTLYRALITSILKLRPGEYVARVILRQEGNRVGGWEGPIKIPDTKKGSSSSIINSIFGFLKEEKKENEVPFSVSIGDGALLLSQYRLYPFVGDVFKKGRRVALFLQIYNPRERQDFSLRFSLQRDGKAILNLPYEKMEFQFDKESKILNEVYLLDFEDIPPGDYQLKIISSDDRVEKNVEIKVI